MRVPRYEMRNAVLKPSSRSTVTLYWSIRGACSPNGIALMVGWPPRRGKAPPVNGCGQGESGAGFGLPAQGGLVQLVLVRPWLNGDDSIASRIPCAAEVGKNMPQPPRITVFSVKRKAAPRRGARLFLSVFTRPRPSPRELAVTVP